MTFRSFVFKFYPVSTRVAPHQENHTHDPLFQIVTNSPVDCGWVPIGVFHRPLLNNFGRHSWQRVSGHVDHQIILVGKAWVVELRDVARNIDVLFFHRRHRGQNDAFHRRDTGAGGDQNVIPVVIGKAFSHRATARVPNADEQDAF